MAENEKLSDPEASAGDEQRFIKLKLKTLVRTDEAYLVDLGQGKVWIPKSAIKSTKRVDQKILEVEVLESVIQAKRREMRHIKEQLTGVKGSVRGEIIELDGKVEAETKDSLLVNLDGKKMHVSKVCFAEIKKLPDGNYHFMIQKDYLEFKLRQLQQSDARKPHTTVQVDIVQETDRAYLLGYEGLQVWYPKRQVLEIKPVGRKWEIVVPTDFWMFKLEVNAP